MNKTDCDKLLRAGFKFIRADKHSLTIKTQSRGQYSHGWKILEKGFPSYAAVQKRMIELLTDEKTIEL